MSGLGRNSLSAGDAIPSQRRPSTYRRYDVACRLCDIVLGSNEALIAHIRQAHLGLSPPPILSPINQQRRRQQQARPQGNYHEVTVRPPRQYILHNDPVVGPRLVRSDAEPQQYQREMPPPPEVDLSLSLGNGNTCKRVLPSDTIGNGGTGDTGMEKRRIVTTEPLLIHLMSKRNPTHVIDLVNDDDHGLDLSLKF